jgi:DNA-directed RNA polymerase specialized sigma24 family protein
LPTAFFPRKSRRPWLQPVAVAARSSAADPLDELTAREFLTILDEELNRLPEKYRLPLILCHLEGLSRETSQFVSGRNKVKPGTGTSTFA